MKIAKEEFIEKAIKEPGALRKHYGLKEGEKIDLKKAKKDLKKLQGEAEGDKKLPKDKLKLLKELSFYINILYPASQKKDKKASRILTASDKVKIARYALTQSTEKKAKIVAALKKTAQKDSGDSDDIEVLAQAQSQDPKKDPAKASKKAPVKTLQSQIRAPILRLKRRKHKHVTSGIKRREMAKKMRLKRKKKRFKKKEQGRAKFLRGKGGRKASWTPEQIMKISRYILEERASKLASTFILKKAQSLG